MDRHHFFTPVRLATFVVGLAIALTLALIPIESEELLPRVGEAALNDVRAPAAISFESTVLTDRARDAAGEDTPTFVTVDRGVESGQAETLLSVLTGIDSIRNSSASESERAAALAAVPDLLLGPQWQILILSFTDSQWAAARDEATSLLADLFASNILESDVETLRLDLPQQIDPRLTATIRNVVAEFVTPLIMANVVIDETATAAARDEAQQAGGGYAEIRTMASPVAGADGGYNIDGEVEQRAGYRATSGETRRFTCTIGRDGRVAQVYLSRDLVSR